MRKLFIFLIIFIAVVTFIRAIDNSAGVKMEIAVPSVENLMP